MIRAQIMSDLHLDFPRARGFPPLAGDPALVLIAGDTCEGLVRAVEAMRIAYPRAEIAAVAGNHEFYGRTFGEELQAGRERARQLGVHLLENETVIFGRLRITGATLWTDYELFGASFRGVSMRMAYDTMRDHKRIKWSRRPWRRFRPQEARMLHLQSRAYIEAELAKAFDGATIVLTHTAPILEAVEPRHRDRMVAAAYASNLAGAIDQLRPDFWISGHTHFSMDLRRGRTRLISNPRGYPDENIRFDPRMVIEVCA
ncbi:metallophosphoesterase [Bradyrhizobium sp. Arg237L]|uniref:metallophosphoesterase n=1 Tax=Bradyrhizobium sp. Arg237L TaxID=3003352 RepID=UPI00249D8FBB|nr:metallophosphoesterase [Bradyrhizobium sp. Arg237L]MDI4237767.1 metallophosphoesterase [Bradyrhizobium sp. Arg237L]